MKGKVLLVFGLILILLTLAASTKQYSVLEENGFKIEVKDFKVDFYGSSVPAKNALIPLAWVKNDQLINLFKASVEYTISGSDVRAFQKDVGVNTVDSCNVTLNMQYAVVPAGEQPTTWYNIDTYNVTAVMVDYTHKAETDWLSLAPPEEILKYYGRIAHGDQFEADYSSKTLSKTFDSVIIFDDFTSDTSSNYAVTRNTGSIPITIAYNSTLKRLEITTTSGDSSVVYVTHSAAVNSLPLLIYAKIRNLNPSSTKAGVLVTDGSAYFSGAYTDYGEDPNYGFKVQSGSASVSDSGTIGIDEASNDLPIVLKYYQSGSYYYAEGYVIGDPNELVLSAGRSSAYLGSSGFYFYFSTGSGTRGMYVYKFIVLNSISPLKVTANSGSSVIIRDSQGKVVAAETDDDNDGVVEVDLQDQEFVVKKGVLEVLPPGGDYDLYIKILINVRAYDAFTGELKTSTANQTILVDTLTWMSFLGVKGFNVQVVYSNGNVKYVISPDGLLLTVLEIVALTTGYKKLREAEE